MSVKAEFSLSDKQAASVLQVPADAVIRKLDGSAVVWVVRNGQQGYVAEPILVTIGRSAGSRIEVTSDQLKPGDSVVILGNENLRPGQSVAIQEAG